MGYYDTGTINILLFGLKLVQIRHEKTYLLTELLNNILRSEEYSLPQQVHDIMKIYQPRNLRFVSLRRPHPIHNFTDIPQPNPDDLITLHSDGGTTVSCTHGRLPGDGSCLNLIIEEPLPFEQLEGNHRFRSKEVILFLNSFDAEIYTGRKADANIAVGWIYSRTEPIWCKLVPPREFQTFQKLKDHDPASHHLVSLVIEPLSLPNGHHLITMPDCGQDLSSLIRPSKRSTLAGPVIGKLAYQLCTAIAFLHSHNMYHLDIKPQNLAVDTDKDCELTVIDLGWVMSARQPCSVKGPAGTYGYVAPEVQKWFDWDDAMDALEDDDEEPPPPPKYNPQKADSWAIGNVILILIHAVEDSDSDSDADAGEELYVENREGLLEFASWMMEKRPIMDLALKRLRALENDPTIPRTPSPVDSAVAVSP